jgi:hypothetical protein
LIEEASPIPKHEVRDAQEYDQTRRVVPELLESGNADKYEEARQGAQVVDLKKGIEIDPERKEQERQ